MAIPKPDWSSDLYYLSPVSPAISHYLYPGCQITPSITQHGRICIHFRVLGTQREIFLKIVNCLISIAPYPPNKYQLLFKPHIFSLGNIESSLINEFLHYLFLSILYNQASKYRVLENFPVTSKERKKDSSNEKLK